VVVVDIKEYHSQKVTVFGQANNGIYTLDHPTYMSEFVASIGGLNSRADQTEIKVTRKDSSVVVVNLKRYYEDEDLSQNILLSGGDQIFIPTQRSPTAWRYFKEWQSVTLGILTLLSLYLGIFGR
jgi:protein involved in polysaccharide export with SLBB domain